MKNGKSPSPSENGRNGRNAKGQFVAGHSGGPGRPPGWQAGRLRRLMQEAVTDADLVEILRSLAERAKGSDTAAVALLDRLFGRPASGDVVEQLEKLQQRIEQME